MVRIGEQVQVGLPVETAGMRGLVHSQDLATLPELWMSVLMGDNISMDPFTPASNDPDISKKQIAKKEYQSKLHQAYVDTQVKISRLSQYIRMLKGYVDRGGPSVAFVGAMLMMLEMIQDNFIQQAKNLRVTLNIVKATPASSFVPSSVGDPSAPGGGDTLGNSIDQSNENFDKFIKQIENTLKMVGIRDRLSTKLAELMNLEKVNPSPELKRAISLIGGMMNKLTDLMDGSYSSISDIGNASMVNASFAGGEISAEVMGPADAGENSDNLFIEIQQAFLANNQVSKDVAQAEFQNRKSRNQKPPSDDPSGTHSEGTDTDKVNAPVSDPSLLTMPMTDIPTV